jgi:hypothetical protein
MFLQSYFLARSYFLPRYLFSSLLRRGLANSVPWLLALLTSISFSCDAQTSFDRPIIEMNVKGCSSGECPTFDLLIHEDGRVTYYGESSVRVLGRHAWRIRAEDVQSLLKQAEALEFSNTPDNSGLWADIERIFSTNPCRLKVHRGIYGTQVRIRGHTRVIVPLCIHSELSPIVLHIEEKTGVLQRVVGPMNPASGPYREK